MFGDNISGAGHLDFIYSMDITDEQIKTFLSEMAERYKGKQLCLYKINQRSRFIAFFQTYKTELVADYGMHLEKERICVKIDYPDTYDEYMQQLSRKARSNLRRAYKRLDKLGITYRLEVIQGAFREKKILANCMKLYTKRESRRKHRGYNFIPYIKHRYFSALTWAMQAMDSQYSFILYMNDRPAAFMTEFLTTFNELVSPLLAMDTKLHEYSPGKIMIGESIKWLQGNTDIRCIDLSRGDEYYKFEMGGHEHYNYKCILNF